MSMHGLNEQQRKAVETTEGPVCIIAGPGTGKTKTLITRIQHLMSGKHVAPSRILAITFTRKAATELKERLGSVKETPLIATFHGLCSHLLGNASNGAKIISDTRREKLIEEVIVARKDLRGLSPREIGARISRVKNTVLDTNAPADQELVADYDRLLREQKFTDYDDLLQQTYHLLKNDQNVSFRFDYILVDEVQDTNDIQYELVKLLLKNTRNIFVIGDPLQSIYAFRGADSTIFDRFFRDYPSASRITLSINYRSAPDIVQASASLFPEVPALTAAHHGPGRVELVRTLNEYTEAQYILRELTKTMGGMDLLQAGNAESLHDAKLRFGDFAVIYRTHRISKVLEQQFEESGIPFQKVGGNGPFENHDTSLIINCLEYLYTGDTEALTEDTSIFTRLLEELKPTATDTTVSRLVDELIVRCGVDASSTTLKQFYSTIIRFDAHKDGLAQCVKYFTYLKDHDYYDKAADKVTLLTMHAAKGLEFEHVFVCGFEDGLIPFIRHNDLSGLDEERRLLYVALTRAKSQLRIVEASERSRMKTAPSRFKAQLAREPVWEVSDKESEKTAKKRELHKLKKSQIALF